MIPVADEGHKHNYLPAGVLMQARKHVITQVLMQRPSLLMLCGCGDVQNKWVPDPGEDEAGKTVQPPGGMDEVVDFDSLRPHDGEH